MNSDQEKLWLELLGTGSPTPETLENTSSPSPRPSAAHWRKECVATPRRGLLSGRPYKLAFAVGRLVTSAGPQAGAPPAMRNPSPRLLLLLCRSLLHPFPFGDGAFARSTLLGEGLKDLGRPGPIPYRNHLPSGRLNYLEMSQLHCYLSVFQLNTTALTP